MRVLILGAGKMGSFFCDVLSDEHEVAIFDIDPARLKYTFGCQRFSSLEEVPAFEPQIVINAATVKYTLAAFEAVLPYLPAGCIISDIASVKTGLPEFYATCGHPYASSHPMFGPTFASLSNLANENAIIISEGDHLGRIFFRDIYTRLGLHIEEYTFEKHDATIAYSLSVPFASTLAFASVMRPQQAPGTTFKRHLAIARGLMSEDDYLVTEILFNPNTSEHLQSIIDRMEELKAIVDAKDAAAMKAYLAAVRTNVARQK